MAVDSSVPRPTGPPRPRGRIRSRAGLMTILDILLAIAWLAIDYAWLGSESHRHGGRRSGVLLLLVTFITAVPLVLRGPRPLAVWMFSTAAITVSTVIVVPHHDISMAYIPGALAVYVLCLYSVAVRGSSGLTV